MKNLILAGFCLIVSFFSFGQEWTAEQEAVLEKYALEKTDHRGLILLNNLSSGEDIHFDSLSQGLEYFLSSKEKKDLLILKIDDLPDSLLNVPMGIFEVTKIYSTLTMDTKN
jgi:hypothetical protein